MYKWTIKLLFKPVTLNFNSSRCVTSSRPLLVKNYYAILGLDKNCGPKEIRLKYMEMCKLHHPDTIISGSEKEIQEKKNLFQDINEAYTQLSRKETRIEHDYELELEEEKRKRNNMYRYPSLSYEYKSEWRVFNEQDDRFWNTGWEADYTREEQRRARQKAKDKKRRREAERNRKSEMVDELYEYYNEEKEYHKKIKSRMERQVYQACYRNRPDIVNLWNQTLNMYNEDVFKPNDSHLHVYPDQERREKKAKKARRKTRYFTFDE